MTFSGTLARMPLVGGAPRQVLEDVHWADWSPDGSSLAIVRNVGGKDRLEFPIGKVLYETSGWISHPRFSPKGDRLAFIDHAVQGDSIGSVAVVDLNGNKKNLTAEAPGGAMGLAWSPSGDEIWYTAATVGIDRAIYGVTTSGAPAPGRPRAGRSHRAGHLARRARAARPRQLAPRHHRRGPGPEHGT